MSLTNAWEVTDEDINLVCFRHGWGPNSTQADQARNVVDREQVAEAVLHYTDFDTQVTAALSDIEDQLVAAGIVTEPKQFTVVDPDGPTFEVIVGNIGTVYTGPDESKARGEYLHYVAASKDTVGRASGEQVSLLKAGEPILEYTPETDDQ